jgi:enamine deaminase RidA (YjgF/YER057c/UK114 family)
MRKRVSSGSPLEPVFGFCRAMRIGDRIVVGGTAAIEPDGSSTLGGAAAQMERCCAITAQAISDLGGNIDDTVRTRVYITSADVASDVMAVHSKWFGVATPVTAVIVVAGFVRPEWQVELETETVNA